MYVLIVSDAPALPVDICIASAMIGHAAWAFRPEEFQSGSGARPSMVLLDIENTADIIGSVATVRARHRDVPIAVLTNGSAIPDLGEEPCYQLSKPVTSAGLREVIQRATQVAA
jgi:hypothetical protein